MIYPKYSYSIVPSAGKDNTNSINYLLVYILYRPPREAGWITVESQGTPGDGSHGWWGGGALNTEVRTFGELTLSSTPPMEPGSPGG